MASAYARKQLQTNPEQALTLKVEGIPADTNMRTEQEVLSKVFLKKMPQFKHQVFLLRKASKTQTVFIQTTDLPSALKVLNMHLSRC